MLKQLDIEILKKTWTDRRRPPKNLLSLTGSPYQVDILSALLFTGVLTAPPVRHGFSLSDCWAWLRYFPCGI